MPDPVDPNLFAGIIAGINVQQAVRSLPDGMADRIEGYIQHRNPCFYGKAPVQRALKQLRIATFGRAFERDYERWAAEKAEADRWETSRWRRRLDFLTREKNRKEAAEKPPPEPRILSPQPPPPVRVPVLCVACGYAASYRGETEPDRVAMCECCAMRISLNGTPEEEETLERILMHTAQVSKGFVSTI